MPSSRALTSSFTQSSASPFGTWHGIKLALINIIALVVVLVACLDAFAKANHVGGNLMTPYLAWVIFATALNYAL
ncbi:hypothetical protein L7F22_023466 [Adiantum nelumboides]|nr:hypothetical protein [Adiantum nelumboides]